MRDGAAGGHFDAVEQVRIADAVIFRRDSAEFFVFRKRIRARDFLASGQASCPRCGRPVGLATLRVV